MYDTEVGSKYGGQPLWHHVKCFAERRTEFNFFAGGENIPGFKTLKKEDQTIVKQEIKYVYGFYKSRQFFCLKHKIEVVAK